MFLKWIPGHYRHKLGIYFTKILFVYPNFINYEPGKLKFNIMTTMVIEITIIKMSKHKDVSAM